MYNKCPYLRLTTNHNRYPIESKQLFTGIFIKRNSHLRLIWGKRDNLSLEPRVIKDIRTVLENAYGPFENRVAVLGSFDTWSYMDFVCRRLAGIQHTVFTSRYIYISHRLPNGEAKIYRMPSVRPVDMEMSLVQYLRMMLDMVPRAVVIYSVCGAHYIETDWLSEGGWDVLGLTFVRNIGMQKSCLALLSELGCSVCDGEAPIWGCLEKHWCPFQRQEISKDVIERYLLHKQRMVLVAIESLDNLNGVLEAWSLKTLQGQIKRAR